MAKQTSEKTNLIKMLSKAPILSGLDERELENIVHAGRETSFEAGQKIIEHGEPGLSFFLVLDGKVEIRKKAKTVSIVEPGGFFGEMTVFDDKPRSADIVAIEPTRCFGMASWSFFPVMRNNPTIAIGIIKELVSRLRRLDEEQFE